MENIDKNGRVWGLVFPKCWEYAEEVGTSVAYGRCGLGLGRDRTAQRGRSPWNPRVLVRVRMGGAQLSSRILESGVGHC